MYDTFYFIFRIIITLNYFNNPLARQTQSLKNMLISPFFLRSDNVLMKFELMSQISWTFLVELLVADIFKMCYIKLAVSYPF